MSDTEDKQSEYPEHWMGTPLGELGEWGSGGTPKSDNDAYYGGDIPWLKIGDLNNGLISQSAEKITQKGLEESSAKLVPEDALLVAMYGSIGKLGITGFECTTNQAIAYCIPNTNFVSLKFLFWALQFYQTDLIESGKGGVQKNISQTVLKNFEIPLPPLTEQRRIVAKIEELFSNLDAGMGDLQTAEQQLERYRLSVLQAAVEGRLTADWRETHDPEPADQLLERILEKRQDQWEERYRWERYGSKDKEPPSGWRDRYKPAPEPNLPEDRAELPDSWTWVSVSQVGDVVSGKTPKGVKEADGEDIPWYRVGDMNQHGNDLYMEGSRVWVGEDEAEELGLRVQPAGTIIFPKRGGAIATNKKRVLGRESAYGLNVMGVVPRRINLRYLRYWFESIDLARFSDGSSVPQLNHGDIEPLALPLPPREEQELIADAIERLLSVAENAESTVDQEHTRADRLRQSILKQAFSGQLVPHDDGEAPSIPDTSTAVANGKDEQESRSPTADGSTTEGSSTGGDDLLDGIDESKQIEMDL